VSVPIAAEDALSESGFAERFAAIDWTAVALALDQMGFAQLEGLLTANECEAIAGSYDDEPRYRSTVVMARHGFGRGEYKYFDYPLPRQITNLRRLFYAPLAGIANRWAELIGNARRYPDSLDRFIAECHAAGQLRPTPLVLRYEAGGYNRLHQDIYGDIAFPLQAAVLLSEPGRDFEGGAFVLTEQRARMQSRVEVVGLGQGDCVLFAVNERPVKGARGYHRARVRHGVSTLSRGQRMTLGIIFHDAR
jgi:hypothetical protein